MKNQLIIFLITLLIISLNLLDITRNNIFTYIIYPTIWLLFITTLELIYNKKIRTKNKIGFKKTALIFSITYIVIYFLLGLLLGFEKSIYDHKIVSIIKNIIAFIILIILEEKLRQILINNAYKKITYIFITILMILVNLDLYELKDNYQNIEYILGTVLPLIVTQTLLTYLTFIGSIHTTLSYIIPIEFTYLITPVFPALNWYIYGTLTIVYNFLIFLFFDQEYKKLSTRIIRNKNELLKNLPFILIIILIIMYVIGIFNTSPIAVMSDSMKNVFSRGDIVIVKKLTLSEIKNLKKGDIIEYSLGNNIILHRIIDISKNDVEILFKTKGDNNNQPDTKLVKQDQIMGIVKFTIPKLGIPSVYFSELLKKIKPNVETG